MHRCIIQIIISAFAVLLAGCAAAKAPPASPTVPETASSQAPPVKAAVVASVTTPAPIAPSLTPPLPTSPPTEPSAAVAPTGLPPAVASTPKAATPSPPASPLPRTSPPPPSPTPGPAWEVETLLIAPGEPGRMYALMKDSVGSLWASPAAHVRLRVSDDWGDTWADFPGGLPAPAECMVNVNLDYATPDALYASTCQGLFVWEGSGGWVSRSAERTNVVAVAYGEPGGVWAAVVGDGVVRSDDGGRTWRPASTGLVTFGGMANLGFDPRDNRTLYGIIRPKYAGSYLRRGTSEGNWLTLPTPANNAAIETGMAIDGGSGTLYVTTQAPPAGLWFSRNPNAADPAAVVWEKIRDFDATARVSLLASGWGPAGPAYYANIWPTWYAGETGSPGPGVLHRSLDGGNTWEALPAP